MEKFVFPDNPVEERIPEAFPVIPRASHMPYEEWKAIVCSDQPAGEGLLQKLYAKGWEAKACRSYMLDCNMFGVSKPPYQRRQIDTDVTQKKVASVAFKELSALLTRNLTPHAREWATQAQEYYRKFLG